MAQDDLTNPPPQYDSRAMKESSGASSAARPQALEEKYIHYRLYNADGAPPCKTAFDAGDPFMGRIAATFVPPPHIVASLKRCLANTELVNPTCRDTQLFEDCGRARSPMEDATRLVLLGDAPAALGRTPETAFAFKVVDDLTEREARAVCALDISGRRELEENQYLYFHLYTSAGEDSKSTLAFSTARPAVGRVERFRLAPPVTLATIKCFLALVERNPAYAHAHVYETVTAVEQLAEGEPEHACIVDGSIGSKDTPLVLVRRQEGGLGRVLFESRFLRPSAKPNGPPLPIQELTETEDHGNKEFVAIFNLASPFNALRKLSARISVRFHPFIVDYEILVPRAEFTLTLLLWLFRFLSITLLAFALRVLLAWILGPPPGFIYVGY